MVPTRKIISKHCTKSTTLSGKSSLGIVKRPKNKKNMFFAWICFIPPLIKFKLKKVCSTLDSRADCADDD
ncbi:hypothetical protein CEXT_299561 [Caerostris extrusa]|uniref:Transmembrane protein n=1 Tax=Caerostris extrusa TaxID=172846 RepID=A0AAV4SCJ9_CAEEX|nr:hypothetical protein CEXT_299561 [Caerostris extrusa]